MDTTPEAAASWLELFDRFGVSIVMLGLAIATGAYILRRLLSPENGILTSYGKTVEESHQRLSQSYERLQETDAEVARLLKAQTASLVEIEASVNDTGERVATSGETNVAMIRCADKACDVVEQLSIKLDAQQEVAPHLADIRSELRKHKA